jgi:hypothetical protein
MIQGHKTSGLLIKFLTIDNDTGGVFAAAYYNYRSHSHSTYR